MSYRLTHIAFLLVGFSALSKAGMIDVTSSEFISVPQGATIEFGFTVSQNDPTSLSFQILGQATAGQPSAMLPGSSQQYDPQFLLDATLTSANGGLSVPLIDNSATRLGLAGGSMVVTTGVLQGSQNTNLNMIDASVQLSLQQSALIFGGNGLAYVALHNDGPALLLGIGPGYDLRSAMVVSSSSASGSSGGMTQQVGFTGVTAAPEPATYAGFAGGFILLMAFHLRNRARSRRVSA
jgi:hypothetical protein